jgi:hypothetical protein
MIRRFFERVYDWWVCHGGWIVVPRKGGGRYYVYGPALTHRGCDNTSDFEDEWPAFLRCNSCGKRFKFFF